MRVRLSSPTAGVGAHEEVDVLDAADESCAAWPTPSARPRLGDAQVRIRVWTGVPRRRLDEVVVAVIACMLEAIAEGMLSIAKGLHVELDLHEEAQLRAEVLVQVAVKRKEGVHHEHLPHRRIQGVLAHPHRLVAIAEGSRTVTPATAPST